MIKIKDVINYLETIAPIAHQESYDNSGLIIGSAENIITGIVITLDCTENIVQEAIQKKCNLIIAHHPIIFSGLKKITGKTYVERTIIDAIKNNIAIYAIHTNLDNSIQGVNYQFAKKLELKNLSILSPKQNSLSKLVCFTPNADKNKILEALYSVGAGKIGNYYNCSFTSNGIGSFTPNQAANPTIGSKGSLEQVKETRIEVIFPSHLQSTIIDTLKTSHQYEEVAYYITKLNNTNQDTGSGIIGTLKQTVSVKQFLAQLKHKMNLPVIRFTKKFNGTIKKIAICGGAGSFLLKTALKAKVDAYVSADFKYHEFFDAEKRLLICDIGHYESEVATKNLLYDILSKKFSTFALNLSEIDTNPISYYN